jgi:hypothetical protein
MKRPAFRAFMGIKLSAFTQGCAGVDAQDTLAADLRIGRQKNSHVPLPSEKETKQF